MKLSREVKTGIFALVAILLFVWGYNFLKGSDLFQESQIYYVKYNNVAGLGPAAPVTVNGMQVGKVKDVYLATNKGGEVIVEFIIDKDFHFSKSSTIKIYSSGVIGCNNLGVIPDYGSKDMAKSGDTLKGEVQAGMIDGILERFNPIQKSLLTSLQKLDSVLDDLHYVMDKDTKRNFKESIAKLNQTMSSFNGAASKMDALLGENDEKLSNTFTNLDKTTENFARFSDSLAQIETGKMMKDLQGSIDKFNSIVSQIESGEGSVGKLLKDEKLYDNLEGAAKQLEQLLQDMKLNPKRYVHFSLFGKRPKPYEVPQESDQ